MVGKSSLVPYKLALVQVELIVSLHVTSNAVEPPKASMSRESVQGKAGKPAMSKPVTC